MDTHLHPQPAHTALDGGLMQRWKQSRGAANTAAHFKSIPFPGHQLQHQHRKPSLILPLLSSNLMVFMHGRTPPARRPTAQEHQKWRSEKGYNWQWSCSWHQGCEPIKHPLYHVYCSLFSFKEAFFILHNLTDICAFLLFFVFSKWTSGLTDISGSKGSWVTFILKQCYKAYPMLQHRLSNMFALPITLTKAVVSLGSSCPLFSSAKGPLSYTFTA